MPVKSEFYPIPIDRPGRLLIAPRPRGGDWLEDEVQAWRSAEVHIVVSLLELAEIDELELGSEKSAALAAGIEFISFPIPDRGVPSSREAFQLLITQLDSGLKNGKTIVIHCRQGIGRAGMVAACLLVQSGIEVHEAIRRVSASRCCSTPETAEQKRWILSFRPVMASPPRPPIPAEAPLANASSRSAKNP